jgi:hypothetical protein
MHWLEILSHLHYTKLATMNSFTDESLKNVFAYLLQHPRGWTKKYHFHCCWRCVADEPYTGGCACCKSNTHGLVAQGNNCKECYTGWMLSCVDKSTLRTLRAYHAACACGGCPAECLEKRLKNCDKNPNLVAPQYKVGFPIVDHRGLPWTRSPIATWRNQLGMLTPYESDRPDLVGFSRGECFDRQRSDREVG